MKVNNHPLLKKMSIESLEKLNVQMEEVQLQRGQSLFFQAEVADYVYYVNHGMVKVVRVSKTGQEKILSLYTTGQFLALSTLFNPPHLFPATAVAINRARVMKLPRQVLEEGVLSTKEATYEWFRYLNRRLEGIQQLATDQVFMGAEERLKKWLFNLLKQETQGSDGWIEVIVPISRQEIADLLGIRRETLSRLLKDLRHLGFVDVQGRTFKVSRLWLANDLKN